MSIRLSQGKKNPLTGKTIKRRMSLQHNNTDCGHTYEVDIYEFIEGKGRCGKCKGTPKQLGQRCTECYRKGMESVASRYVRNVLDHLYISYECEKRFYDCINPKTRKTLPFDYYIPEINTLIEIDGEQHERGSFSKYAHKDTVKRDKIKNQYAEKKGIELVRIPAKKWSKLPEYLYAILSKISFQHLHWKKSKRLLILRIQSVSTRIFKKYLMVNINFMIITILV